MSLEKIVFVSVHFEDEPRNDQILYGHGYK